jgi:hypothetical protein
MTAVSDKARRKKCPICGEVFIAESGSRRLVLNTRVSRHVGSVHSEYHRQTKRWSRRFGIYFFLGLLIVFEGFIGTSTRYGGSGRPIIRSGTGSPYFLPSVIIYCIPIALYLVYTWRLKRHFINEWRESPQHQVVLGGEPPRPQESTHSAEVILHAKEEGRAVSSGDQEIIENTRDLCSQLGIKHYTPNLVRWLPIRPAQNCDFGVFDPDEIDIPISLRNKLDLIELRPIIASSLIYSFIYKRRRASALLVRLLASLTLLIPMAIFLAVAFIGTFGVIGSPIAGLFAIAFIVLLALLPRWLRARLLKEQRLEADRQATAIVGTDPLLKTLQKIDMLHIKNVERLKQHTWKSRISDNPSISARIQQLSQGPLRPAVIEMVAWKGRPSYHLRYPVLSIIFFLSLATIDPGPIKGQTAAVLGPIFFLLWIAFICATVATAYLDRKTKYYVTNTQIITPQATLSTQDLVEIRIKKSILGKLRRVGNIIFDAKDGRSITFKHVKNPERVKQSMGNAGIARSLIMESE